MADVVRTGVNDAAVEIEDDVVEEGAAEASGLPSTAGCPFGLGENRSCQVTRRTATEARIRQTTS